jgi:hypothetical protein
MGNQGRPERVARIWLRHDRRKFGCSRLGGKTNERQKENQLSVEAPAMNAIIARARSASIPPNSRTRLLVVRSEHDSAGMMALADAQLR